MGHRARRAPRLQTRRRSCCACAPTGAPCCWRAPRWMRRWRAPAWRPAAAGPRQGWGQGPRTPPASWAGRRAGRRCPGDLQRPQGPPRGAARAANRLRRAWAPGGRSRGPWRAPSRGPRAPRQPRAAWSTVSPPRWPRSRACARRSAWPRPRTRRPTCAPAPAPARPRMQTGSPRRRPHAARRRCPLQGACWAPAPALAQDRA